MAKKKKKEQKKVRTFSEKVMIVFSILIAISMICAMFGSFGNTDVPASAPIPTQDVGVDEGEAPVGGEEAAPADGESDSWIPNESEPLVLIPLLPAVYSINYS